MPDEVVVVPYDPAWPRRFGHEAAAIARAFAAIGAVIEHIGSTAVPGLGAKPVIDIMVGVRSLDEAERRVGALEAVGYAYVSKYEAQLPERRYFRRPRVGPSTCHLHCVVHGGAFWIRHLAFRDYLRAHPESADAYYALKQELAVRVGKAAYTDAKGPFIERIVAAALGSDDPPRPRVAGDDRR